MLKRFLFYTLLAPFVIILIFLGVPLPVPPPRPTKPGQEQSVKDERR